MKKYILSYLTENYFLDKSQLGNAGIYNIGDNRDNNPPVKAKELIEEIVTLFGYGFTRTKWIINDWAKKQRPDLCLKFYWGSHDGSIFAPFMPLVRRVAASTIGQDLVQIKLLSKPRGKLFYIDYNYGEIQHPTPDFTFAATDTTRQEIIRKWQESGLLEGMGDSNKQNIALLLEGQAKQLLK